MRFMNSNHRWLGLLVFLALVAGALKSPWTWLKLIFMVGLVLGGYMIGSTQCF
jgi:hypothetical protein